MAARTALLDQSLSSLPAQATALSLLRDARPDAGDADARTRLALLGLDAERSLRPLSTLSGGERLKAALAAVLYAHAPPQLLLLDEPGNHLDLPSLAALEQMLSQFRGTLMLVSHDPALLRCRGADPLPGRSRRRLVVDGGVSRTVSAATTPGTRRAAAATASARRASRYR